MSGDNEITYWIDKIIGEKVSQQKHWRNSSYKKEQTNFGRVAFDNIGSQRVLEKCGFIKIGTDKGFANARQEEIEEYIYSLSEREWSEGKFTNE